MMIEDEYNATAHTSKGICWLSQDCVHDITGVQQAETRDMEVPLGDGRAAAALGFGSAVAAAEGETWQDARWEGIPGGVRHAVSAGVAAGFQMAAAAGPLCDEPLWGVAFEVWNAPLFNHGAAVALSFVHIIEASN